MDPHVVMHVKMILFYEKKIKKINALRLLER